MEVWELCAREQIRDTLARYNWSGDALKLDELAQTFCEGGQLELRGSAPVHGREAIIAFLQSAIAAPSAVAHAAGVTRIVRHNVTNIRFIDVTPQEAQVACYFTVFTEIGVDHFGRYRDVFVPVDGQWLISHRFVSTDWRAPDSTMA